MSETRAVRGRPRSATSRRKTLDAAFELLGTIGYPAMSIELVAATAGVAKSTIYRSWPDRAALAVDAFFANTEEELRFPDHARGAEDFRAQVHRLAGVLRGPRGEALAALIAGGRSDPALRRAIGERWVLPRKRWGEARLARAVADGECRPGLDIDAALTAIYSALYAPLLLGRGVEPAERLDACLDIVFAGIFVPSALDFTLTST